MKKVINGKLYDTASADQLAEDWNGLSTSDLRCCTETLYKTQKGNYFLHGEGGALTEWAEHSGNQSSWGCDIVPMERETAAQWLADNGFTDVIEKEFPDLIEEA